MATNNSLKIIFAGTPEFAVPILQGLINSQHQITAVFTQPDRPAGRGQKLHASPVKLLAQQHNLPVHQAITLRDENTQKQIADYQADVMIVVAYGLILPQVVLDIPRLGCINVHASLLPRWRGAAPIQRAILAGDTETGITIMQMDKGLDTGDYYLQKSCVISSQDTAQTLHDKLALIGAETLLNSLEQLINRTAVAIKQDNAYANYAEKLNKSEAKIDWTKSAVEIDRAIRAFNPWPVAFTHLGDLTVRIWQGVALENSISKTSISATPGTIIHSDKSGIDVLTSNGILRIQKLQLPGGKPLAVNDLLNAHANEFSAGKLFNNGNLN